MKETTLSILITLLMVTTSFSQEIGLRGGMNLAKTGGDSENISIKNDYHVGVFWTDDLTPTLLYFLDATYSRQGGQVNPSLVDDYKINNSYANLSSLIGLRLGDRFRFFLGPQLGVRLNGRIVQPGFLDENYTDDLSLFNFSIGSELQYRVQQRISIYTRYAHGLTSNVSQNNPIAGRFPDRVFQIGIAVNVKS